MHRHVIRIGTLKHKSPIPESQVRRHSQYINSIYLESSKKVSQKTKIQFHLHHSPLDSCKPLAYPAVSFLGRDRSGCLEGWRHWSTHWPLHPSWGSTCRIFSANPHYQWTWREKTLEESKHTSPWLRYRETLVQRLMERHW